MRSLQCAGCDKPITNSYITALGKTWHAKHFVCASCDQALDGRGFLEHEGKPYCEVCYHREFSPECTVCKKPIVGRYVTALDKTWHPEHFVCAACGRPFGRSKFLTRDDQPYCETCYHQKFSPQCTVCRLPIRDSYIESYWGEKYCSRHKEELDACFSCARPICQHLTEGGVRYQDGRTMCNLCRSTAVDQIEVGRQVLTQVKRDLEALGFDLGGGIPSLGLVGKKELVKETGSPLVNGRTRTSVRTQGEQVVERAVEEIVILYGLPRVHFAAVAAHEFGHVWLFQQEFPQLEPVIEEGLCELFAYLWLQRQRHPEADFQIHQKRESDDPVYGAGFHLALRNLKDRSLPELLEYVRQHRRFPQ